MADLIQFRGDVASRWRTVNPILAERELGLITDSKGQFKIGDGVTDWNNLPLWGFNGTLANTTGDSEESAASQALVTKLYKEIIETFPNVIFKKSSEEEISEMVANGTWAEGVFYYSTE